MGRIRVLRQPFALLLRPAPAPGHPLAGLPVAFALAGAEADERDVPLAIFTADPDLTTTRPGQALPGGKNYYGAAFETALAGTGIKLLRPARHGEPRAQPRTCSNHCARSSNQSTTPSRASSTSNATAATHPAA